MLAIIYPPQARGLPFCTVITVTTVTAQCESHLQRSQKKTTVITVTRCMLNV